MKKEQLYKDLAKYYDLLYAEKDYSTETKRLFELIGKKKGDLLDVACGTGGHLPSLSKHFNCVGLDLHQSMIQIAKKKAKNVPFVQGDMATFTHKKKYDVILCLFSSIGYVKTYAKLQKTINNFSHHLKDEGVLVIEPWFTKKKFYSGTPYLQTFEKPNLKIARVSTSQVKNDISIVTMHYLIAEKNKQIIHTSETHTLGLFSEAKTLKILKDAGLKARFLKNGLIPDRGLYVAKKT